MAAPQALVAAPQALLRYLLRIPELTAVAAINLQSREYLPPMAVVEAVALTKRALLVGQVARELATEPERTHRLLMPQQT